MAPVWCVGAECVLDNHPLGSPLSAMVGARGSPGDDGRERDNAFVGLACDYHRAAVPASGPLPVFWSSPAAVVPMGAHSMARSPDPSSVFRGVIGARCTRK
jgi:hypothetical protein